MFLRLCSRAPWMTRESVPTGHECNGGPRHARWRRDRTSGDAGLSELAELLAELVHLVTQARGVLEPKIPCGLVHLLLEPLDQPLEFLRGDALRRLEDPLLSRRARGGFLPAKRQQDVGHLLADGLRVDPMLLVVRELDLSAALRFADRGSHRVGH